MSDLYDKLYEDIAACARAAIPVDPDDGTTFIKIDGVTPIWGSPDIVAAAVASAMYTVVGIRLDDARAEGVAAGRKQAAADIRALVERRGRFVTAFPPVTAEATRRNDAVLGAYREAARIAEGGGQ